ncbi:glycosyltransferase [Sphingomonas sp.]|uniref:glycosyltransferase n=1 Tax=Sphingomonas sp. TaxID=28214 RepID=UPI0025F55A0C|nr:glycosyltransferase [Sphingomonas sp.]
MRLGIVLHDFALGGTERIAVRLAEAWAKAGADVEIFCGCSDGPIKSMIAPEIRVAEATPPIPRGIGSLRRLAKAAARHFGSQDIQAVFVPGNFHWPVIAELAKISPNRRPTIVAQISSALHKQERGGLRQQYFEARSRRRLARADAVVALSDQTAREAQMILRRPVETIRLPVLPDKPQAPSPVPEGQPMVVAAGRFVHQKDFPTLVEAFAKIRHPTATLAIIGDGPQYRRVASRARALGLEQRVSLPGYVPDIRPWLDRCRLFVLSSRHEGYGAVIVEALAAGRPVVTTDCTPASLELLRDETIGMTVPISNPAALACALDIMLNRPAPDPAEIARNVDPWRIGPIAAEYLDLFRRPCSKASSMRLP